MMNTFSLQTATLADLWAAYSFVKMEIDVWNEIVEAEVNESAVHRLYELRWAAKSIRLEISHRIYTFIQPPIKA